MTATPTIHELETRDQHISQVKVFTDRAEIRRFVKVALKSGVNEVVLKVSSDLEATHKLKKQLISESDQ